jgi:multiple sugar transport system substrate-binding protein
MTTVVRALLALALTVAPLTARAADFVLWWDEGFYPEEDRAIRELVDRFEQETGKTVELVLHPQEDMAIKVAAAAEAGATPDFVFTATDDFYDTWAYQDRLVDLSEAVGPLVELFDADLIETATKYNARAGKRALYALPIGRTSTHVHVWRNLLEQAGFKLEDIPKDWEPFWAFWCDRVQPAVRKALGREDIWAVGLPMSARATDTRLGLEPFMAAYGTGWRLPDNQFVQDDPEQRPRLVQAVAAYTSIYKRGCTPPDATEWENPGNNKAFLTQRVLMTVNNTLSIPNAVKESRPDDYYRHIWTIAWPRTQNGQPLPLRSRAYYAIVPKDGPHPDTALAFVRFLVGDMALADYLVATHQRFLPPMRKLLEQPFWLDSSDPHLMMSAIQLLTQPQFGAIVGNEDTWRTHRVIDEFIWERAVHHVAAEGWSAERAADEALALMAAIWKLPPP